jgi:hypothetical protein
MKYGFSLLLVCMVTAAGVAIWLLGIDPIRSFRSANGIVRQEPQPPPEASLHPKAKQASKPIRPRIPQTRAVIEPATTQEVPTLPPIVAGDQIPTATQKEAIVNTNGNPALSIRRVDHGHDLESLVYTRDRGREVTIISLEDGKVSSAYSQSGITSAVDAPRPRSDEHTAALLTGPAAPHPASVAIAPPAAAPRPILKVFDHTLTEVPTATKPPGRPSAEANLGTCGEYRDGKLIVKPCSQVPLSPSEWLAKGSGASPTESGEAKRK